MNDDEKYYSTLLVNVEFLTRIGMYKEAFDYLNLIDKYKLSPVLLEEYYYSNYYIYNELAFSTRDKLLHQKYLENVFSYIDSILPIVDVNSMRYMELKEKLYLDNGDLESAIRINNLRFSSIDKNSPDFGNVGFMRSIIYWIMGDQDKRETALLLTAIADTESGKKDIAALHDLSTILYNRGEIDKAYDYMQHVVECAKAYNGTLRVSQISEINSLINSAYFEKEKKQKRILTLVIAVISFLCAITFILIFYIIRQMKTIARTRNQLAEANIRMS